MPSRATRRTRTLTAAALTATVALALSACSALSPGGGQPGGGQGGGTPAANLAPSGPVGSWLRDEYAQGTMRPWQPAGDLCGFSADGGVAVVRDGAKVVGYKTGTDEVVYTLDKTMCIQGRVGEGRVLAFPLGSSEGERPHHVIDAATGATQASTTYPAAVGSASYFGYDERAIYVHYSDSATNEGRLRAFAPDGTLSWDVSAPGLANESRIGTCAVAGTHLVCQDADLSLFGLYDAATGQELLRYETEISVPSIPVTEGIMRIPAESILAIRGEVIDTSGRVVDEVKGLSIIASTGQELTRGIVYPAALYGLKAGAVAQDGTVVATSEFGDLKLGSLSTPALNAVLPTRSGGAVMVTSVDRAVLYDRQGTEIAAYDKPTKLMGEGVVDGFYVQFPGALTANEPTTVLLPA